MYCIWCVDNSKSDYFFMDDPNEWSKPLSNAAVEDKVECEVENEEEVVEVIQAKPASWKAQPIQPENQDWSE